MFPLLSLTATGYSDTILYSFLRWVVLVEVFQNAWSFSVFSQTKKGAPWENAESSSRRQQGGAHQQATKGSSSSPVPYPWRKSEREHNDEHRLEDIFLDEVSESGGPDDNYHFEDGTFQFLEGEEGAGSSSASSDSFVAQNLEEFDDGEVIDRGFPSTMEDLRP